MHMQSPNLLKGGQEGEKSWKAGPSQECLSQKRQPTWGLKTLAVERKSRAKGKRHYADIFALRIRIVREFDMVRTSLLCHH